VLTQRAVWVNAMRVRPYCVLGGAAQQLCMSLGGRVCQLASICAGCASASLEACQKLGAYLGQVVAALGRTWRRAGPHQLVGHYKVLKIDANNLH